MDNKIYSEYLKILNDELLLAMGCTEPIAIAYAAALARKTLGIIPEKVEVRSSANIIKNVKSVVVPNTDGLRGIEAAVAAGTVAGNPEAKLQVLSSIDDSKIPLIREFLKNAEILSSQSENPYVFDMHITAFGEGHSAEIEIAGHHTNVILIKKDGTVLLKKDYAEQDNSPSADRELLTVEKIVEFADCVKIEDVSELLQRQIDYNTAIANEGLRGKWGANIGNILLNSYGNDVHIRAKAYAAAGSDARMNGCQLPVVINSGSGNQGLTASLPVIVYAEELKSSKEELYRALVVSNLITIHMKTGIGRLSAYCGATSAGCGAGAGISYLYGGKFYEIAHTIVNAVAINSGMICDGAKASCAAKIASAVEAGLLGMQMQRNGSQFYGGDGIIVKGVENTIRNIGELARKGMCDTDRTIIQLMIPNKK